MIPMLVLGHLLIGAILGLRFGVSVLVPATVVSLALVAAVTAQSGMATILGVALAAWVALQFGYLVGAASRGNLARPQPRGVVLSVSPAAHAG
ncbi:MAG: hypothetical protein HC900_11870 [Methylacidiphilales bacterium]|nr:hypothetical protein [Candidatus Methylacidiphilales bacterium]